MKLSFVATMLLAAGLSGFAQGDLPRMLSVDPASGKAGDVIAVTGENLDKTKVEKVFLTDGKNDIPVEVTEQSNKTIKFKIPAKAATGERLAVMILTAGKDAKYIEQPVRVMIEP
ncbi:MAG TPA: IPT/TIG domain-containing protein [Bryobacteraceae bacterium]|nr:IPT/TIG domain-containing protein [Bryobacteraceae bacterium]